MKNYNLHGGKGTKLYEVWCSMRKRCNCNTDKAYKSYGARGIKVCKDWDLFTNFRSWSFENGYKEGLTIDRIDNNGNYEPNNCRWVSMKEQGNNKRTTKIITYKGDSFPLDIWAKKLNIGYATLYYRIFKLHWEVDRAFEENVSLDRYHRKRLKELQNG